MHCFVFGEKKRGQGQQGHIKVLSGCDTYFESKANLTDSLVLNTGFEY